MATSSSSRVIALLGGHLDEYQRFLDASSSLLDSHVSRILTELNDVAVQDALHGMSIGTTKGRSPPASAKSFEEELSSALILFMECALDEEVTKGNKDSIDRILELTAAVTGSQTSVKVVKTVLERVILFTKVVLERLRSGACRFIGIVVAQLMKQSQVNAYAVLLDQASQALLPCFTDKSQAVRQAAVEASGSFFTSQTTHPDLLQALLYAAQHDPSVAIRVAAVRSLPVTLETLDRILSRVRDIKPKVRVAALQVVQQQAWDMLEPEHCVALIELGMTNR